MAARRDSRGLEPLKGFPSGPKLESNNVVVEILLDVFTSVFKTQTAGALEYNFDHWRRIGWP